MNFGTWKASTNTCQSTITARCTIRMIAKDRADPPSPLNTVHSLGCAPGSRPRGDNLSRPPSLINHLVDYGRSECITRSTTCLRRGRLAARARKAFPENAHNGGGVDKKEK